MNKLLTVQGVTALNGWIASPSPLTTQAMAMAGWDAMTVDMQHGTADYSDLLTLLPIIERAGSTPLVRVPWLDEAAIMRTLDAGAMGIIAPMIESAEDARRFVAACRYPPAGRRSFGPIRARMVWLEPYTTASADANILTLAMIETRKGIEALPEILTVEGLSGIYIGPADLALSYGYPAKFDPDAKEMVDLIKHVRQATKEAGLYCGLHCGSPSYAQRAARWGMDLVTVGSDARFVEAGAAETVQSFFKKSPRTSAGTGY